MGVDSGRRQPAVRQDQLGCRSALMKVDGHDRRRAIGPCRDPVNDRSAGGSIERYSPLPSLMPMLWRYQRGSGERAGPAPAVLAALAGIAYFLVWTAFGLAAYAVGTLSAAAEMSWTAVARSVPIATGIALLLAGIVQLTEWKARQLDRCRDATRCGVDARNVWSHGLRV